MYTLNVLLSDGWTCCLNVEYQMYVYFVQYLRHVLKLLPFQGATAPTRDTQGVASLALGYVLHWAFIDIIGCGSAIQASLIAFALHDDSARPC